MRVLAAWIGTQDLRAPSREAEEGVGPIANVLGAQAFERVILIANQEPELVRTYVQWLDRRCDGEIKLSQVALSNPTDFGAIHTHAVAALEANLGDIEDVVELTLHLSSGTPAMAAVWIILSQTRFPAELVQSSRAHGVQNVDFPFEVSAELIPTIMKPADERLVKFSAGLAAETHGDLVFRSPVMERLAKKAGRAAQRSVPVLIEGETGTEKELLARYIHDAGPRNSGPLISLSCASLTSEAIEAELFGSLAGMASQSDGFHDGAAAGADQGTLYLEEIDALSLQAQARLQRLIESGIVQRPGSAGERVVDVRVIASTGPNLIDAVAAGRFREELFYGLAVLVLKIPPLRERSGDIGALIEMLLSRINEQSADEPGYLEKTLSPAAKNFLMQQSWPGNLRELENTLRRAAVWSEEAQISEADVWESVFSLPSRAENGGGLLGKPIEDGVDLQALIAEVAQHYITRAIEQAEGNKTTAAKLVGLPSYQTLTNWMKKYDVT